jgi:hypothetical protein
MHRAGPTGREAAYLLLRLVQEFAASLGARRVVILIDEGESVYTKLAPQARAGAYRVLSALCESSALAGFCVAIAMTPDACHAMATDVRWMAADASGLPDEPVRALARTIEGGEVMTLQCRALDRVERAALLERVRALYRRAYPAWDAAADGTWARHVDRASHADISPRLLVREAMNLLDSLRYGTISG